MKCEICNKFQGKWPIGTRFDSKNLRRQGNRNIIIPSFTWDQLLFSSKTCYGCGIITTGCRGCFNTYAIDESDILRCSLRFIYPSCLEDVEGADTNKDLTFYMKNGRRFEIELFAVEDEDAPIPDTWDYIPMLDRTSPATDSKMALATMKGWIARCITDHCAPKSLCDSPRQPELPTRVVDVGSHNSVVRIVETKGAKAGYLCLSHCWGCEQIVTTTKSTFEKRKVAIEWGELSKTFQDAIALTRSLGFDYIWIDSLCIIQDDAADWAFESAKMASVYSNGYLTIAATRSASGSGGLYAHTPDVTVSGILPNGEEYCLFFREKIDHHIDAGFETGELTATETHYPLLSRAWVYQERMLSTRVIHFGKYEMFFECKSSIDCECGSIGSHGAGNETPVALIKLELADNLSDYGTTNNKRILESVHYQSARLWRTMVCCYTALSLTKSKDRLPAIGGLARQMRSRRGSKYLAGLWEDALQDDLLWEVYAVPRLKKPRPYPHNAPTWSWASVETFVGYSDVIMFTNVEESVAEEREPFEHFTSIDACTVEKSTVDEFGSIKQGSLTITGLVAEGTLESEMKLDREGAHLTYYASVSGRKLPIASDYLLDHDSPGQVLAGSHVCLLRMSLLQVGKKHRLFLLVLRRSPSMPGTFERIGTSTVTDIIGSVDSTGASYGFSRLHTVVIV